MLDHYPILHTMNKGSQVRHLLLLGSNPGAMKLIQLVEGVETTIDTGTQYEMDQDAMSTIQKSGKEGFKYRKDNDPPVFESLTPTLALLMRMGFTKMFDPAQKRGTNVLGVVPLAQWQGRTDRRGDDYEYGYTSMKLYAQPKVTAAQGVNMRPATNEEFFAEIKKAVEIRKNLGPEAEFILG